MIQVLLDAPATPARRIQVARLGPVSDERYGEFEISRENAENWQRNLEHLPGKRALIDFEHRSERKPRDSQAAGWITGIELEGDAVMADVEWTPKGAKAIRSKQYLFVSPAYGTHRSEDGTEHDDTLVSVGLTNKPRLDSLPMLTLAAPERLETANGALRLLDVSQADRDRAKAAGHSLADGSYPIEDARHLHSAAVLAASKHGDWKAAKKLIRRRAKELGVDVTSLPGFGGKAKADDAPPPWQVPSTLLSGSDAKSLVVRTLDLPADADESTVIKALAKLKKKASKGGKPLKTLAAEKGLVMMDAGRVKKLERDAAGRAVAEGRLHAQRFETAFELALKDPKGARVAPAEKDRLKKFYLLDADETLKLIDDRESIVPAKPRGEPVIDLTGSDADSQELIAAGVDPGSHQLDQKLKAKLRELGRPMSDYPMLLDQVHRGELVL